MLLPSTDLYQQLDIFVITAVFYALLFGVNIIIKSVHKD